MTINLTPDWLVAGAAALFASLCILGLLPGVVEWVMNRWFGKLAMTPAGRESITRSLESFARRKHLRAEARLRAGKPPVCHLLAMQHVSIVEGWGRRDRVVATQWRCRICGYETPQVTVEDPEVPTA